MKPIVKKEHDRIIDLIKKAIEKKQTSIDIPAKETLIEALEAVESCSHIEFNQNGGIQLPPLVTYFNKESQTYTIKWELE